MNSAVAFFIFRRPEYTRRVWAEIRKARPPVLLIVADGPVGEADREKSEATRAIVADVDWPCDVRRNYSDINLGCRDRMASGLNWVFSEVEEAIILEDDCLPDPSFFIFCDTLLSHYRHDARVMHIGGNNILGNRVSDTLSYHFSRCVHIWGWATWRRAWQYYDVRVASWPAAREAGLLRSVCSRRGERSTWAANFDRQFRGASRTWDYSWVYTVWAQHGLAIVPNVNLVSNIGLGSDSTHQQDGLWYMNMPTKAIGQIKHPVVMMTDEEADEWTYDHMHKPCLWDRLRATILNPWAYGPLIRQVPFLGRWWGQWRDRRKQAHL